MADVFQMRFLTEAQIRTRRGVSMAIRLLMAVALAAVIFCTDSASTFWQPTPLMGKVVVTGILLFVLWGMAECIGPLASATYQWLPQAGCGLLADDCDRYTGLQPYRDAVCASGRRFTMGEYRTMRAWAHAQHEKAARNDAAVYLAEKAALDLADSRRLYGPGARDSQLQ